ncbi:MAG TPA: 50S ribosomal protein L24 [Candidatus Babeliales bacterium]|jgi:large subunit ribosomal protein L24|nr:50S ribosomal protein L24 [Candidatus Babeliales bacterium]
MIRIKKNDVVHIISGKDAGKQGEVIEVLPKKSKIKVKGIALQTHHVKASKAGGAAGIKVEESFIDLSNVMPICKITKKPCRVNAKILENGKRMRVSSRSGESL